MTKAIAACIWLAIVACATMRNAPSSSLPLTRAASPVDLRDTVLQLAIRAAIAPDSSRNPRRVLLQPPPSIDPHHIIPALSGVVFVTLDSSGFQNLADRIGIITVWAVGAPKVYGDSAEVAIWEGPVSPRGGAIAGWGGGCTYVLKRSTNGWRVEKLIDCIYIG